MDVNEKNFYLKVFKNLYYDPTKKKFIGIRDYTVIEEMPVVILESLKSRVKTKIEEILLNKYYGNKYKSEKYKENVKILLTNDQTIKAMIFSILKKHWEDIYKNCYLYSTSYAHKIYSQEIKKYPLEGYNNSDLLNKHTEDIKERYITIFRQTKTSSKVFLRSEFYADENNMFHRIPVTNLDDSRKHSNGNGTKHIPIPFDQNCFIVLSDFILTANRISNIKYNIESGNIPPRVMKIPPINDLLKQSAKAGNNKVLLENNVCIDNNNKYVMLTDHMKFAKDLKEIYTNINKQYHKQLGYKSDNKQKQLLALVASTCGRNTSNKNYWSCIHSSKKYEVRKKWNEIEYISAFRELIALECIRWLTSEELNDTIYDYYFGKKITNKNTIYSDLFDGLQECDYVKSKLTNFFQSAQLEFQKAYNKSCKKFMRGQSTKKLESKKYDMDYWLGKTNISTTLSKFPEYAIYNNSSSKNFLVEEMYKNVKTVRDATMGILTVFASSAAQHNTFKYNYRFIKTLFNRNLGKNAISSSSVYNPPKTNWNKNKESYKFLHLKGIEGLSKAISTINMLYSVRDFLKNPDMKNSVILAANICDFAQNFELVNNSVKADKVLDSFKIIKKDIFLKAGSYANIIVGVIDFYSLLNKDDIDAAIVKGGSQTISGILGLFAVTNPALGLAGILIGVLGSVAGDILTDNDTMKWLQYSYYGDDYAKVINNKNVKIKPSWSDNFNLWSMPESQILAYSRIVFSINFKNLPILGGIGLGHDVYHNINSGYKIFTIDIAIEVKNFDPYASYQIDFIVDNKTINNIPVILSEKNAKKTEIRNLSKIEFSAKYSSNRRLFNQINKRLRDKTNLSVRLSMYRNKSLIIKCEKPAYFAPVSQEMVDLR